ncbi:MAG: HD domain-containing protein [Bradymonadales bacterium]|jgi:HD superfamily phosphohydrolase
MTSKKCEKLFRDPVHNVIHFNLADEVEALLLELIDSAPLQRLRHIKQLGLAYFVYHGAEHSRFGHSLGCTHMTRRLFYAANGGRATSAFDRAVVLCSALLHDVGHAPFSHAFETSMETIQPFAHERVSEQLILWEDGEVYKTLAAFDAELPAEVAACISHRSKRWYGGIISGQLDADRMDYILRDGWMTGVKNYMYDADRIIEMLDRDEQGPVVGARAIQAVESYLLSRFHMYQQVYHHKAVRGGEKLVEAIFKRLAQCYRRGDDFLGSGSMATILRELLEGRPLDPANYIRVSDNHAWVAIDEWSQSADACLADLAKRLMRRRFFKTVEITPERLAFFHLHYDEIAELCRSAGFAPEYYLALDSAQNRAFAPYAPPPAPTLPFAGQSIEAAMNDDIRIKQGDGTVRSIQDVSPIVKMLTQVYSHIVRSCFPEELRPELLKFFKEKQIIP